MTLSDLRTYNFIGLAIGALFALAVFAFALWLAPRWNPFEPQAITDAIPLTASVQPDSSRERGSA